MQVGHQTIERAADTTAILTIALFHLDGNIDQTPNQFFRLYRFLLGTDIQLYLEKL